MSEGIAKALTTCYVHKGLFFADVDKVASIYVDSETRLPLDVNPDLTNREWTQEEKDNASQVYICVRCMRDKINPARIAKGKEPIPILDSEEEQFGL